MDTVTPAITVGREKNLPDGEFGHSSGRVKLTATTQIGEDRKEAEIGEDCFTGRQSVHVGGRNRKREL